jgi:glucose/arabinose dehydrogenase
MAQQPDIGIAPVKLNRQSYIFDTAEQHKIKVTVIARDLPPSFSLVFLPDGDALVTERGKQIHLLHDATGKKPRFDPNPVPGIPQLDPYYQGGGLQDLALHPDFANNRLIYFTYNKPGAEPPDPNERFRLSELCLMRGHYQAQKVSEVTELFCAGALSYSGGTRIAFGKDGKLFMTSGAPFTEDAQKLDSAYGKVLRFNDDGSIPDDNPFVHTAGARGAIYSLGHRDQLGLTIEAGTGAVLAAEHGPNGGDEVNLILPGRNYGWPKYSFGRTYEGPRISGLPVAEGFEQAIVVWLPSIAPSGLTFYSGDRFPAWKGNLFVGSGRRGEVPRTGGLERVVFNDKLEELRRETLLTELHQHLRDVRQGPDGLLYVLIDGDENAVLRIEPTNGVGPR